MDPTVPTVGALSEAPTHANDADGVWALTAPAIAGRTRMRLAETRGTRTSYPAKTERDLSCTLPAKPAAVMISDTRGRARTLCLDLDAHESHTPADVQADYETLRPLLEACGLPTFADTAHGGIHVYVLIDPVPMAEARELVGALARRFRTLDVMPHSEGDPQRCITTPGTTHKRGGHRTLLDPLEAVQKVIDGPRGDSRALAVLRAALCDEITAYREELLARGRAEASDDEELALPDIAPGTYRMNPRIDALARSGDYRAAGKPSASEARFSILCSAVATGMTQSDVRSLIAEGTWVGLGQLIAHKEEGRLAREWKNASQFIAHKEAEKSAGKRRKRSVHRSDTSAMITHRGGTSTASNRGPGADLHRALRTWRATLHQTEVNEFPGASGYKARMVLRVLAAMAHAQATTTLAVGVRSLALGSDLSHETASQVLRELRADPDPWIVLLERGDGADADVYELRLPDRHQATAERVRWVRGKSHGVRSVFSELGIPAALVFEAAEQGHAGSVEQIMLRAGLSKSAVYVALQTLLGWHLIEAGDDGYQVIATDADLDRIARRLGAHSRYAQRLQEYRRQRKLWREWLETFEERRAAAKKMTGPMLLSEREVAESSDELEWCPWWEDLARGEPPRRESASAAS